MSYDALDDFAGPGGWDEGARMVGLRLYGVDYDRAACEARLREYVVDRRTNSKAAGGGMAPTVPVSVMRPAPTLTSKSGSQWVIRGSNQANAAIRDIDQPAPTMLFAHAVNDVRFYPKGTERPGQNMPAAERPDESFQLTVTA